MAAAAPTPEQRLRNITLPDTLYTTFMTHIAPMLPAWMTRNLMETLRNTILEHAHRDALLTDPFISWVEYLGADHRNMGTYDATIRALIRALSTYTGGPIHNALITDTDARALSGYFSFLPDQERQVILDDPGFLASTLRLNNPDQYITWSNTLHVYGRLPTTLTTFQYGDQNYLHELLNLSFQVEYLPMNPEMTFPTMYFDRPNIIENNLNNIAAQKKILDILGFLGVMDQEVSRFITKTPEFRDVVGLDQAALLQCIKSAAQQRNQAALVATVDAVALARGIDLSRPAATRARPPITSMAFGGATVAFAPHGALDEPTLP